MPDCRMTRREDAMLGEHYAECLHPSGLTVLVSPKDFATYHATLRVRFGASDRRDAAGCPLPMGLAHFLEHKMFEREEGSWDDVFSSLGADANAYTSDTCTAYHFSCTDGFEASLAALLSMVITDGLSVGRASVSRERSIIAEEIRMNLDDPWERLSAELRRALYARHPIREEICGTEASIRRITPRLLRESYAAVYRPERMVLSVCGPTTPAAVMAVVDRVLGELPAATPHLPPPALPREPATAHRAYVTVDMPAPKPLFAIGIKASGASMAEPDSLRYDITLTLLSEMLFSHAGEFYDRLFSDGLIGADLSYDIAVGLGYAFITLSGECRDPGEVFAAFDAYVKDLHRNGLPAREFERARRILRGDYLSTFDASEDIADALGDYAMDGAVAGGEVSLYDFLPVADTVTLSDVTALFTDIFRENRYTYVALGDKTSICEV